MRTLLVVPAVSATVEATVMVPSTACIIRRITGMADATINGKAIRSRADLPCPGGEGGSFVLTFKRVNILFVAGNDFDRFGVLEGLDTGDFETVNAWMSLMSIEAQHKRTKAKEARDVKLFMVDRC